MKTRYILAAVLFAVVLGLFVVGFALAGTVNVGATALDIRVLWFAAVAMLYILWLAYVAWMLVLPVARHGMKEMREVWGQVVPLIELVLTFVQELRAKVKTMNIDGDWAVWANGVNRADSSTTDGVARDAATSDANGWYGQDGPQRPLL